MPKRPDQDSFDKSNLPDDLSVCHNLIRELLERVAELEKQLSRRKRSMHGAKSAKVDATLLTGTGKAIHDTTTSELEKENDLLSIVPEKNRGGGRSRPGSNAVSRNLEHRIESSELPCPCCGNPREIIGFEVSRQLEFDKALFEYIQHIMFKYSCQKCNGQIITAQKPYQPIDKGLAGPGLLAKIATDKFWLHLPLYRQEQVFDTMGLAINRVIGVKAFCRLTTVKVAA